MKYLTYLFIAGLMLLVLGCATIQEAIFTPTPTPTSVIPTPIIN